jgi:hypothetical protein
MILLIKILIVIINNILSFTNAIGKTPREIIKTKSEDTNSEQIKPEETKSLVLVKNELIKSLVLVKQIKSLVLVQEIKSLVLVQEIKSLVLVDNENESLLLLLLVASQSLCS